MLHVTATKITSRQSNILRARRITTALAVLIAASAALIGAPRAWRWYGSAASGTITGVVFQDYNANGARDVGTTITNNGQGTIGLASDRGIQGVTVTAYDGSGAVTGSATTDGAGAYTLTATGTGPYRIEFSNLPAGFQPGPHLTSSVISGAGTSVQFVADGNTSNVNLSLVIPLEYCQSNPTLATSCYVFGNQSGQDEVIVSFPYSAGTTRSTGPPPFTDYDSPVHGIVARANQVGTTWG
ncbi:MAG: SdrD B-like domain-containing protein, partial [Blastocatellia bacterium]